MSGQLPVSVFGNSLARMREFRIAVTTSASSTQDIAPGSYRLISDVDCWVMVKATSATAVAPATTQPASASATMHTIRVPPGVPIPLPIEAWAGSSPQISALALSGSGTLSVEGPLSLETPGT